jgi:two-component system, chemotaxis family, CheB/CheR fusion protein
VNEISRKAANQPVRSMGRRILVVEDNDDVAQSLRLILTRDGHIVSIAQDGPVALGSLRTFEPDIVLLDIGLPGMDGFELTRRIRKEGLRPDLIIVALSGYGEEEHRRLSQEAGCDEYLVKPTHPDVLRNVLGRISHSVKRYAQS